MKRYRIVFIGRVQGVGFRFKSMEIARRLGLSGYVLNDYDGTVVMEVQGQADRIDDLCRELEDDRYIRIDKMFRTEISLNKDEKGFTIR